MGAPYSLDLRQRAVGAVADGMSCAEAAELYQVSHSSVIRWTKREAETGSPATLPMGGKKHLPWPARKPGSVSGWQRSRTSPAANCWGN